MASLIAIQRAAVLLVWLLALWNTLAFRGLFWDGAPFLASLIELGRFHDGHTSRTHVLWATQWPVLLALEAGVTDTAALAFAHSAGLFAVPAALYHLALHRVRRDGALLAAVLAVVAAVYLPTSFFIVGEYNAAYAAATATATIVLVAPALTMRDAALLAALGLFCLRSYEAMLYLGPLLAAMIAWSAWRAREAPSLARLLAWTAAGFFAGSAIVAGVPMVRLWEHDYGLRVRGAVLDFWQNLQFMIGLATLGLLVVLAALRPALLRGPLVFVVVGAGVVLLVATPWLRELRENTYLFPPAHYVARTAAGGLLWLMLAGLWLFAAWRARPPLLFVTLREPAVGRRLSVALLALLAAAAVPDMALTIQWSAHLEKLRGLIVGKSGIVRLADTRLYQGQGELFRQEWSVPALSLILRRAPTDALVLPAPGEHSFYTPECGVPAFAGYTWKGAFTAASRN
jgi:hypothetical protein